MNFKELFQDTIEEVLSLIDKLLDRIPEERRRLFLLISGGLVLLAICFTLTALVAGRKTNVRPQMAAGPRIPPEELFYPKEPDFLPPLLLEREPHQPWTVRDLEVFWQDPKTGNGEKWREAAKAVVDKLMEGVR